MEPVSACRPVQNQLRIIDLFAGAGGLSEGFRQEGFAVIAASDIDPDACATYALNFPSSQVICGDIRLRLVRERVTAAGRGADVVVGGPPCQAFSQVRNHARLIDDPRNSLYREFVKMVGELQPAAFVMENVPGMAQMGVLRQVKEDLGLAGAYEVSARVLNAADFGVPQTRKRIVFLGVRRDMGIRPAGLTGMDATRYLSLVRHSKGKYAIEGRGSKADSLLQALADPDDVTVVAVAQAISDLRYLRTGRRDDRMAVANLREPESAYQRLMRKGLAETLANVSVPRINADTATRLRRIPPGGNYRDLPAELTVRNISGQTWGRSSDSGTLGRAHYYAYRRLHPNLWAWTLNTKADSAYHYSYARALSVREFARLQSFSDYFVITTDLRVGTYQGESTEATPTRGIAKLGTLYTAAGGGDRARGCHASPAGTNGSAPIPAKRTVDAARCPDIHSRKGSEGCLGLVMRVVCPVRLMCGGEVVHQGRYVAGVSNARCLGVRRRGGSTITLAYRAKRLRSPEDYLAVVARADQRSHLHHRMGATRPAAGATGLPARLDPGSPSHRDPKHVSRPSRFRGVLRPRADRDPGCSRSFRASTSLPSPA